ncbi:MAG: META domain-containing protein [Chloroflexi bacterium]|nr:META domain-containing protein [Chloroflexota bacterium]
MKTRLPTLGHKKRGSAAPMAVIAVLAAMLIAGIACTGAPPRTPTTPTGVGSDTAALEPTATGLPIDGATWILESIDGQSPIADTHLTLTVDGPQFGGFDGCNSFGGRHESGQPIIKRYGTVSLPVYAMTAAGCPTPAILGQAKRYLAAMKDEAKARVVGDHLHILDGSGQVVLVFAREQPLPGQPVDLVGTSWRLVDNAGIYGEGDTTILFLNSWSATGTTVCRDYTVGYAASAGGIRSYYKGMSGSVEPCTQDAIHQEHQYVEDFGWADEYAIHQTDGAERLVVRTSRGKTLTFEPLPQSVGDIFQGQWRLISFLESRSDGSGMRWPDNTDVGVSENITAVFDAGSFEGSFGRASCAYRAVGPDGTPLVGADKTISIAAASVTENSCEDGVIVSPKQQRYLNALPTAERYTVFGERLVIITSDGGALVFQPE